MEEYIVGIEMTKEEIAADDCRISNVKVVKKIEDDATQEPSNFEAIVEGLLYLVGEDGLKTGQVAETLDISYEDAEVYLNNIQTKYKASNYGIELINYGGSYKFVTKQSVFPYAQKLFQTAKSKTLSQSALETLAIVAYKQPVTRIEIEELRGVGCDMMLRKLEARNLIREAGRSEAPGRPILYEVTEEFMDSFKLYSLDELPDLPEFNDNQSKDLFE